MIPVDIFQAIFLMIWDSFSVENSWTAASESDALGFYESVRYLIKFSYKKKCIRDLLNSNSISSSKKTVFTRSHFVGSSFPEE